MHDADPQASRKRYAILRRLHPDWGSNEGFRIGQDGVDLSRTLVSVGSEVRLGNLRNSLETGNDLLYIRQL